MVRGQVVAMTGVERDRYRS